MLSAIYAECQSVINNPFMLEVVTEIVITSTVVMLIPVAPLETPKNCNLEPVLQIFFEFNLHFM